MECYSARILADFFWSYYSEDYLVLFSCYTSSASLFELHLSSASIPSSSVTSY